MRTDHLYLGEVPADEPCAQVGEPDYMAKSRVECRAYINQLRRINGKEPEGARFYIKSNQHDFGAYLSVECEFIIDDAASTKYAFGCEEKTPARWDAEARLELRLDEPKPPSGAHSMLSVGAVLANKQK